MDELLKSRRINDALKLLDGMLKQDTWYSPNNNTIDIVLTAILKRGWGGRDCGKAWDLLNEIMSLGGDVKMASCNALLTELGKECDFVKMNLLMEEMKEREFHQIVDQALEAFEKTNDGDFRIETDVVLYNTLIDGLCKVWRQEEGLKLMEMEVNVVTLDALLDAMCKHGRVSSAVDFFSEMQEKGLKANAIIYTILITSFCRASNINKAMKLFEEMLKSGLSPDALVYNSLISGLAGLE
ncbi:Hypothetical predicted protein [Olea europaea subsp. europaea]|uniref:Pentatricopeptide repeat-containing protein n=1 Tax=Olea europaea subsp. europaea TaxID=158383 RepID=A0A8S0TK23_OLEEU|nr:Hypothetical predicted protein [Olea europaea subsp. europaea]